MTSPPADAYLDYDTTRVNARYPSVTKLAEFGRASGRDLVAPYHLVFDYTHHKSLWHSWGTCTVRTTTYSLPRELWAHRDVVVARMRDEGKIRGADRICARVVDFRG